MLTVLWWWRSSYNRSSVIPVLVSIHRQWRKIIFQRMLPGIVPSFPKTLNGYQYHSHWLINRVRRWSFRPMRFRTETFDNQSWNDIPQITTGIFSSSFASVFDSTFISEFHRLRTTIGWSPPGGASSEIKLMLVTSILATKMLSTLRETQCFIKISPLFRKTVHFRRTVHFLPDST